MYVYVFYGELACVTSLTLLTSKRFFVTIVDMWITLNMTLLLYSTKHT